LRTGLGALEDGDGWFFRLFSTGPASKTPLDGTSYPSKMLPMSCLQPFDVLDIEAGEEWHGYQDEDVEDDYWHVGPNQGHHPMPA